MGRPDFENLIVYQLSEKLANEIWYIVKEWDDFAKNTIGKQIVRGCLKSPIAGSKTFRSP